MSRPALVAGIACLLLSVRDIDSWGGEDKGSKRKKLFNLENKSSSFGSRSGRGSVVLTVGTCSFSICPQIRSISLACGGKQTRDKMNLRQD